MNISDTRMADKKEDDGGGRNEKSDPDGASPGDDADDKENVDPVLANGSPRVNDEETNPAEPKVQEPSPVKLNAYQSLNNTPAISEQQTKAMQKMAEEEKNKEKENLDNAGQTTAAPAEFAEVPLDLVPCSYCGRKFTKNRLKKHEQACSQVYDNKKKKRGSFNSKEQRMKNLFVPDYVLRGPSSKLEEEKMSKSARGEKFDFSSPAKKEDWKEDVPFLDLGEKRRVSIVPTFGGGQPRVDIREFWQDWNQKWIPTKKGTSLSLEAWGNLKSNIAKVDKMIAEEQKKA